MYRETSNAMMKALLVILLSVVGLSKAEMDWLCGNPHAVYTVPYPSRCSTFILCNGTHGSLRNCPNEMWYDQTLLVCRSAELVECYRDVPDYVKLICNDVPGNATIPGIICERYYECNYHRPIEFECQNGHHYSRAYSTCMNPIKAGCKAFERMCTNKQPGFGFPTLNCQEFYRCSNNFTPVLWTCPTGLYYSADRQTCESPELSGCIAESDESPN